MLFQKSIGTLLGGAAVMLAAASVAAPAALAADPTDLVVTGGSVSVPSVTVGDLSGITLSGTTQNTNATVSAFSVTDSRGSGAGWHVTAEATQFAEWDGTAYVASGKTLPASSLSMTAPTVAANGTTSPDPSITSGPYAPDGGGAVTIASAALDEGMGQYDFTPGASSLTLSVPASAYAKTYRSDVTVSVVTGP